MDPAWRLAIVVAAVASACAPRAPAPASPPVPVAAAPALAHTPPPPPPPPPDAAPAPPPFQPTSFHVAVSGHGRPIILIPGLGCPGSVWAGTVAHFAHAETHVLTLAGFAGQDPIAQPLSATVRTELAAYIRDRHLDHPVIIGHSLGGFIAYWLAASEPELVGPTIVVDAFPAFGSDPGSLSGAASLAAGWKTMSAADFGTLVRDMFAPMANDGGKLAPVVDDVLASDRRTFADAYVELFATDLRPQLPHIAAPVLIVLADGPFQGLIREQIAAIPLHDVVVVPHTRHFVMFDDPAGFFRAVDRFLAKH
jgi:pimeloyl-ACP methyl ester carboxylesterase